MLAVTPTRGDFGHTNIDNDIDNDTNIDNEDSDSDYLNSNSDYLDSDSGEDIDNAFPLTSVPPKGTEFDTSNAGLTVINAYTR